MGDIVQSRPVFGVAVLANESVLASREIYLNLIGGFLAFYCLRDRKLFKTLF